MSASEQTSASKPLSKAQQRVVDAMREPNATMIPPYDSPGHRTGYVTTGGLKGYLCPVPLATLNVLLTRGIIMHDGYPQGYKLTES